MARTAREWMGMLLTAVALLTVVAVGLGLATIQTFREKSQTEDARLAVLREKEEAETRAIAAEGRQVVLIAKLEQTEADFQKARQTLDAMLARLGDERLANAQETEPLRQALLSQALAFYRDQLKQKASDPTALRETVSLHRRLAEIHHLMGQHDEAVNEMQNALALLGKLFESDGSSPQYREELIQGHLDLAALVEIQDRHTEAQQHYDKAIDVLGEANNPALQQLLSTAYRQQGRFHQRRRKSAEALTFFTRAEAIRRTLHEADLSEPISRFLLAQTQLDLGDLHRQEDRRSDGEKAYRQALDLLRPVAGQHPDALARARVNLGTILHDTDRVAEAETQFKEAIPLLDALVKEYPGFRAFRADLALCCYLLGQQRFEERRLDEAGQHLSRALALQKRLVHDDATTGAQDRETLVNIRLAQANVLQASARHAEAEKVYLDLLDSQGQLSPRQEGLCRSALGQLCQERNQLREAEQHFLKALEIQQKQPSAERSAREHLASTSLRLGNLHLDTGRLDETNKALDEAVPRLERLGAEFPKADKFKRLLGVAYFERGRLYAAQRQRPDADDWYRKALDVQQALVDRAGEHLVYRSDLAATHFERGHVQKEMRRHAEAEKSFLAGVEIAEKLLTEKALDSTAQRRLGLAYFNLGRLRSQQGERTRATLEKADAWYRKALAMQQPLTEKPGLLSHRLALAATQLDHGQVLASLGRGKEAEQAFAAVITAAEKALAERPDDPELLHQLGLASYHRGNLQLHEGQHAQAKESLLKALAPQEKVAALRSSPRLRDYEIDLATTLNNLAMLLSDCPDEKFRDVKSGLEYAERAVKLAPTAGATWNTAGICRYRKGDWKESRADFGRSMALRDGGDSCDWYFLAMIEWRAGNKDRAKEWFDKAKKWHQEHGQDDASLKRYQAEAKKLLYEKP